MKKKNVAFQINAVEKNIYFADEEPEIFFNITEVEGNKFKLKCNIDVFSYDILQGKKYIYLLFTDSLYRCDIKIRKHHFKYIRNLKEKIIQMK